jgi:hypothetical protein
MMLAICSLIGGSAFLAVRADAQDSAFNAGRTQLVFGNATPDGGVVSDVEFGAFLDQVVVPRFPNGFNVVTGFSEFETAGVIFKEGSFTVTFIYPSDRAREANRRINEVRELYKTQFQQESVPRIDDAVRASF